MSARHTSSLPPVPTWETVGNGYYGQPRSKAHDRAVREVRARAARPTPYVSRHALHVPGVTVSLLPLRGAVRVVPADHCLTGTPIHYHLPR